MATAKKSRKSSGKKKATEEPPPSSSSSESESGSSEEEDQGDDDMKLTLEALDAMSDDSDDDNDNDLDMEEDNEEGDGGIGDGEAEAAALRKMISDGKFDGLLKNAKKNKKKDTKDKKVIGNDSDDESEEEEDDESGVYETANVDDGEYEDIEQDEEDEQEDGGEESDTERYWMSDPATKVNESEDDESSSDSDDEKETQQTAKKTSANIAMESAIQLANRNLPWAESFTIVPPTPLPFNPSPSSTSTTDNNKKRKLNAYTEEDDEEEDYVDIHDDLKREVAFYDNALESVTLAREQCESVGIPFTRPDDFFAEMVKSDDHMAKIKDRLIFETKKMEAVERRKSNKEQTAMAKERHAFRIAEKSKQKKEHMAALNDWKKNTERNRSNLGGKVNDWQDDEDQLRGMSGGGVNKKRMAANKKYGFGDKRGGRFKQNDKRTLNDMSGYNPRGGFGGIGQKSSGGKGKGKGKKRPGKRARDAKR